MARGRRRRHWVWVFAALQVAASSLGTAAEPPRPGSVSGDLRSAIRDGIEWILAHPATRDDGGFEDLVDEALFFRVASPMAASVCCPDPRLDPAREAALERLGMALDVRVGDPVQTATTVLMDYACRAKIPEPAGSSCRPAG